MIFLAINFCLKTLMMEYCYCFSETQIYYRFLFCLTPPITYLILLMDNQIIITCMVFNVLHVFGKGLGGRLF